MRHNFLLDENLLYHAIRGVNEHDNPDETAAELLRLIARICHTVTIHQLLLEKYWNHLRKLARERSSRLEAVLFINAFIRNSAKRTLEYDDLPELPADVRIPRKDEYIVKAALVSRPIIVTADAELREAIKSQPVLALTVFTPKEALDFIKQT